MLGDNNNSNETKKYTPSIQSEYKMSNPEGIDPSSLSFSFWNGLLSIKIAPKKANSTDEFASYDYDNAANVFISDSKARIFASEIDRFIEANGSIDNVGVNTKHGLISICDGKKFGVAGPLLVVRDLDANNGNIISQYIYQFKTGFHYGIENFNDTDSKYNTVAYDNLELEQFKTVLEQFYISMTNAMAYSVINCNRFNDTRIKNSLDAIKENLGISTSYSGNSNKSSGGSFFSKNSSYDDIKDNISAMED